MSLGPAEGRGGAANPGALLRSRKVKKASQLSVVEEMSSLATPAEVTAEPVVEPAPAVIEPAPAAAPIAAAPAVTAPEPAAPEPVPAAPEPAIEQSVPAAPEAAPKAPRAKKSEKAGSKKTGFWQTYKQWGRTRSTYDSTRHLTKHRTLDDYLVAAVEMYDKHNEEKYNNGEPFDSDPFDIPKGRPIGG